MRIKKRILTIVFVYLIAAILWGVFPPSASGANPPDEVNVGYLSVTGHGDCLFYVTITLDPLDHPH